MNNIDLYKLKYSKYKSKYLELKQKNLEGGLLPKVTGHVGFYMDPDEFEKKYKFHERKIEVYFHGVNRTRSEWEIHKNKDKVNLSFDELCKMSLLVIPLPKRNINEPANPKEWIIPTKCNPSISIDIEGFKKNIEIKQKNTPGRIIKKLNDIFNDRINAINTEQHVNKAARMLSLNNERDVERQNITENMDKTNNTETLKNLFLLAKSCFLEKKPLKVYFCMFEINRFNSNEIREHEVLVLTPQDYATP